MKVAVTGGGGFLGQAIVAMLLDRGDAVTVMARGRYPEMESLGASSVQVDLAQPTGLDGLLGGHDAVIHTAAKAGAWGPMEAYRSVNVDGTRHLMEAAKAAGIQRFVHTSSPSVTFNGTDAIGATEADCGYPEHFEAPYPATKAEAEQRVLAANAPDFATTALRPHLIYGPRDPHILPRLIDRRSRGRLRQIGDGTNRVGLTYVDNAAIAHVQALDALAPGSANAGKAYFITDGGSVVLWNWINRFFTEIGMKPVSGSVSVPTALKVAGALEWTWRTLGLSGEPPITRWAARELASSHWYDVSAAESDFGYVRCVEPEEGFARTVKAFARGTGEG